VESGKLFLESGASGWQRSAWSPMKDLAVGSRGQQVGWDGMGVREGRQPSAVRLSWWRDSTGEHNRGEEVERMREVISWTHSHSSAARERWGERQSTGCGVLGSRRGLGGEEGDGCRGQRAGDLGDWRERRLDSLAVWSPIKAKADVEANIPLARAGIAILCDVAALHSTEMGWDGMRPTAARSGLATWLTPSRLSLLTIAH
jgi:hypothetical protein